MTPIFQSDMDSSNLQSFRGQNRTIPERLRDGLINFNMLTCRAEVLNLWNSQELDLIS